MDSGSFYSGLHASHLISTPPGRLSQDFSPSYAGPHLSETPSRHQGLSHELSSNYSHSMLAMNQKLDYMLSIFEEHRQKMAGDVKQLQSDIVTIKSDVRDLQDREATINPMTDQTLKAKRVPKELSV